MHKLEATNRQMLAVSDSAEELANLRYLLAGEFGQYLESGSATDALKLIYKFRPTVLVLVFQRLETAEKFHRTLHASDGRFDDVRLQTVLLCDSSEEERAYSLCQSGTFDDFVAHRPLPDPYRIQLSIHQALRRHTHMNQASLISDELTGVTARLGRFIELAGRRSAQGDGQHRETIRAFQMYTHNLSEGLEELQQALKGTRGGASAANHDTEVDRHFANFRQQKLEGGQEALLEVFNETDTLLKHLKNDYDTCAAEVAASPPSPDSLKVLLVDDDETYREILSTMLRDNGIVAIEAEDGAAALSVLQHTTPNIILLDYQMPGMDGIATLEKIKADEATRDIPVIMLTVTNARETVTRSIDAGADEFIVKPSDRQTILARVQAAADSRSGAGN
jgi:CheY-like chemotaxis protein